MKEIKEEEKLFGVIDNMINPESLKGMMDIFIRDACKANPMAKSEAKGRLNKIIDKAKEDTRKEVIEGYEKEMDDLLVKSYHAIINELNNILLLVQYDKPVGCPRSAERAIIDLIRRLSDSIKR